MYRNVMVPVDGSPFSREAVFHGLRIASQSGATLRLVRVAAAPPYSGSPEAVFLESATARELNSLQLSELYAIAAECRAHSTVTVTASLEQGPVLDGLIRYAKRHLVDLIVIRSHARSGVGRVWFGSVADGLIRESGIPVLVVRPPSIATGLANGAGYKRILVPLDGSAPAEEALGPAVAIALMEGASITLLRVVAEWPQRLNGDVESALGPASAQEVTRAQQYLDSLLNAPSDKSLNVTRRVVISRDIPLAILDIADAGEVDLVALATHGYGGLKRVTAGSVSDEVLRRCVVSTLITTRTQSGKAETTRTQNAKAEGTEKAAQPEFAGEARSIR